MDLYTLAEKHDYDYLPEAAIQAGAGDAPYADADQSLTAAFSCAGTAGTFGTAGGCIGTVGTFGCASLPQ